MLVAFKVYNSFFINILAISKFLYYLSCSNSNKESFSNNSTSNSRDILFLQIDSLFKPLILIISSRLFFKPYILGAKKRVWSHWPSNFNFPIRNKILR